MLLIPSLVNNFNLAMAYQSSEKDITDDFKMQRIGNFLSCASRGDRVGLNMMLREGISPNVQDYDNRTALHLAASEGHASIVELLLHYKADVNLDDRWHRTPLTDARLYGHRDICRILEVNGGKDSIMNSPMTVRYEEDAKEVNIEISEINSENSEDIEQGVFGKSKKGSLDDILKKKIGLDLHLALRFALDIARNLLQDEGGHLKIGEYWVQMLYELHPNQETQNSGTINKQLINKGRDIQSFGLIFYQMVEAKYIPDMIHLKSLDFQMTFNAKCPARIQQ
ncbi:unnamed protein product [Lactuca saligna]|uniref:Uncharacterized protein n=1 Tax=Lactuca saligna TaxID=75948 RepID=A0AA35YYN4_LACSI|nr:unnamed protein product [Lactuca saligna]